MDIRPAVMDDADAIGALWEKLVAYHHLLDPALPMATFDGADAYAGRIEAQINDRYSYVLVAEDEGVVVGYVVGVIMDMMPDMFEMQTNGFLADIFVEPDYRGQGIGRRLVDAMRAWFQGRGVRSMEWYVAARNRGGIAFWRAMGGRDVMMRMRVELD